MIINDDCSIRKVDEEVVKYTGPETCYNSKAVQKDCTVEINLPFCLENC